MERKLFGTDGVRGIANKYPMTPEMAMDIGRAGASVLLDEGKTKIVIGKDTRISCDMLESALIAGITSTGIDCLKVGVLPTPGIAYITKKMSAGAGIVISASHNPFEDNGIKFFGGDGFKLPDEIELKIEELIFAKNTKYGNPAGAGIGRVHDVKGAKEDYINFIRDSVPSLDLSGMKIVLDCANGATYEAAPQLFTELGADVISLNSTPDGANINLNCGAVHPEVISKAVVDNKADVGLSFDGDGDRLIASDENGKILDGDYIMAICAKSLKLKNKLKNNLLVITVMSNLGLSTAARNLGIDLAKTQVGDRYVAEEMQKRDAIIGGEDSGHIIFLDKHTTGDGIFSAVQLLNVMKEENQSLSELAKVMQKFPQITVNVDVKNKPDLDTIPEIKNVIADAESKLEGRGRVLVRYSGTQPLCRVMAEAPTKEETEEIVNSIAGIIKEKLGV